MPFGNGDAQNAKMPISLWHRHENHTWRDRACLHTLERWFRRDFCIKNPEFKILEEGNNPERNWFGRNPSSCEISIRNKKHSTSRNPLSLHNYSNKIEQALRLILQENSLEFNPLNPNIKIQILICYPYAFSIEVVGRICWSIGWIHLVWSCP